MDTRSELHVGVCNTLNEGSRLARYAEVPMIFNEDKRYKAKGIGTHEGMMVWIYDGDPGILPVDLDKNICDYDYLE